MKRKIRLILSHGANLYALATDGTLWVMENGWKQVVPLPDDNQEPSNYRSVPYPR